MLPWLAPDYGISFRKSAKTCHFLASLGLYGIHLIQSPTEPSSWISQACDWCFEEEGQLAQKWGVLESMGGASLFILGELMSLARGGYIGFLRRSRIFY